MATHVDDTLPHEGVLVSSGRALAVGSQAAGRYRIVRLLGTGGMGEVYEAEDLIVGGTVALKTLLPELAGSSSAVERFRREIALARKVTSPNICRLHDVGTHEGRLFITMELLAGNTLADRVKAEGAQSIAEVERIARQLIAGLAALHAAGIVHRDFKTGNVMLVDERAVITDFGLARSTTDRDATLTAEGGMLGTPAYMAPEQVQARPATAASDIYALGVVLFELATGTLPFREDTAMATATARLSHDPPKPSTVRAGISAGWDARILRCMARDPADRFARVEDVLAARGPRSRRWVLGGALVVACAAVGGVWMAQPSDSTEPPKQLIEPPRPSLVQPAKLRRVAVVSPEGTVELDKDPWRAALTIDVHDALATTDLPILALDGGKMWERPGGTALRLSREKDPSSAAWKLEGVDAVVRMLPRGRASPAAPLQVDVTIDRRGAPLERVTVARPVAEAGLLVEDLATVIATKLEAKAPRIPRDAAAFDLALYERYGKALLALYTIENEAESRKPLDALYREHPALLRAGARLAMSQAALAGHEQSKPRVFEKLAPAEAISEKILAVDPDHPLALTTKGIAARTRFAWKEAETLLRRAHAIAPNHSRIKNELALALTLQGNFAEGIPLHLSVNDSNPLAQTAMTGRSWALYFGRRYDELVRYAPTVRAKVDGESRNQLDAFEALALLELARFEDAYVVAKRLPADDPYWQANAVSVYAASNHRDEAVTLRAKIGDGAGLALGALMDDALGRTDQALAQLERLVDSHNLESAWLRIDRFSTTLRSHPRFQALMKRVFP